MDTHVLKRQQINANTTEKFKLKSKVKHTAKHLIRSNTQQLKKNEEKERFFTFTQLNAPFEQY